MSISFNPLPNIQEFNTNQTDNNTMSPQVNIFAGEGESGLYSTNNIGQDLTNSSTASLLGINLTGNNQNVENESSETAPKKTSDILKKELDEIEKKLVQKQKEYDECKELTATKKEEAEEAIELAEKKKGELDSLNSKIKEKQKAYEAVVEMSRKDPNNAGYKTQIDQKKSELDGLNFLLVKTQVEYDSRLNASIEKQKEFNELKKQLLQEEIKLDTLNENYSKKETAYNEAVKNETLEAAAGNEPEAAEEPEITENTVE